MIPICIHVIWGLHMNNDVGFHLGVLWNKKKPFSMYIQFLFSIESPWTRRELTFFYPLIKLIWATYRFTTQTLTLSSLPAFSFSALCWFWKTASQLGPKYQNQMSVQIYIVNHIFKQKNKLFNYQYHSLLLISMK